MPTPLYSNKTSTFPTYIFFNYYAEAIEITIQTAVSAIDSSLLSISWKDIKFQINTFLDYAATHTNSKIYFHESQIHLWIHSDDSYLNESKYCSQNDGFFYLSEKPRLPIKPNDPPPKLNVTVLVNSKIINTKCLLFNNLKLAQVSSMADMLCPSAMPYMKWSTSKVQHQFYLTTLLPTA